MHCSEEKDFVVLSESLWVLQVHEMSSSDLEFSFIKKKK